MRKAGAPARTSFDAPCSSFYPIVKTLSGGKRAHRDRSAPVTAQQKLAAVDVGRNNDAPAHKVRKMNKLLQNVNLAGTSLFFQILGVSGRSAHSSNAISASWKPAGHCNKSNQSLALPHISVPDISWIDWQTIQAAGFKVCIFDKDNTISEPFALTVPAKLLPSFQQCQQVFGSNVVLYSNSAGLYQYDPKGEEAAALEAAFGVHVLRHREKKPAGGCEELQQQFNCAPHEMVFIGDRYLTDVVYGNRHGMLTLRVAPLTSKGEPPSVTAARVIEEACVKRWTAAGIKAPLQQLMPHEQCARIIKQQSS
eukprot:GHUV01009007.1.p1 GENE.GHUV01009007.1~~GHUV01009007.1.p1  ORF type:complete len:309 (+),score=74.14 GHUV01009007.1:88-1014(+)